MASFLGPFKTKIGDSLRQVEIQEAQKARVQNKTSRKPRIHSLLNSIPSRHKDVAKTS